MRVSGGIFGGRILKVPKTDSVRPTQDRVRAAVFNIIRGELARADFLDLFAGSGAVGIEALSQGASSAVFVEQNRRHIATLNENLSMLKIIGAQVVCADVYRWIAGYSGRGFSIVFADPPYALGEEKGYAAVLADLAGRGVVRPGGLFIAEMTAVQRPEQTPGWELLRERTYGKTRICIWRLQENQNG
jgi:16S rRNA (guanine(966)-N(2))-methyltransferase RsmD